MASKLTGGRRLRYAPLANRGRRTFRVARTQVQGGAVLGVVVVGIGSVVSSVTKLTMPMALGAVMGLGAGALLGWTKRYFLCARTHLAHRVHARCRRMA